ncbi:MAG: T9SS type A sorting domain-containing protein, partial [Chitinophagaceae bacterium]|nr:T9SS type A sorting domain-containing protein [Chitinophagaceae bacterium]
RKVDTFGIISTFAGSGSIGYGGDGGSAVLASLTSPQGIAFDTYGNAYIADAGSSCIRKVDLSGIITTIAGTPGSSGFSGDGGPASGCLLNHPRDIAIDHLNNIYILDFDNLRIRKISPSGIISTVAGNGSSAHAGDGGPATAASFRPNFISVDPYGNLYISTILPGTGGYSYIRKVDITGTINTIAGSGPIGYSGDGGPATAATISSSGLCVDTAGNIIFADGTNRVRMINGTGIITTIAGNGTSSFSGDRCLSVNAAMRNPLSVTSDYNNSIYVLDNNNFRVRKIVAGNTPSFNVGSSYHISTCRGSVKSLDTLLSVNDPDITQTINWSIITPPTNGVITIGGSALTTGGTILPSGFSYSPSFPYAGSDSFTIVANDCGGLSDTTTIRVAIDSIITDLPILGIDSICVGSSSVLASPSGGGIWTSAASAIATISSTGTVTGVSSGLVTISYIVDNSCGSTTSTHNIFVKNDESCNTSTKTAEALSDFLQIWPNPATNQNIQFRLTTNKTTKVRIHIYNTLGEQVYGARCVSNSTEKISLPDTNGVYIAVLEFDGKVLQKKISLLK